jgi:hypothetical protein
MESMDPAILRNPVGDGGIFLVGLHMLAELPI